MYIDFIFKGFIMAKVRIIKDDEMVAVALLDKKETHPSGEVFPVLYVGYGDDIMLYCSMAWIDEQKTIWELDYTGGTDFKSIYENIILKLVQ